VFSRPRYPKVKDIAFAQRMLALIPVDMPLSGGWRESDKGVPNFRFQGQTNEVRWTVDIYAGKFFTAQVADRLMEQCDSLQSVLLYLHRMLRVSPVPAQPSNREPS
jgi:hypothetical protein